MGMDRLSWHGVLAAVLGGFSFVAFYLAIKSPARGEASALLLVE